MLRYVVLSGFGLVALTHASFAQSSAYDGMIAAHAAANGVPVSLVRRVIMRESRFNPRAVSKGNYGIMQIRLQTARGVGYTGGAAGLLDANTNMTYAVKYLAGAYRVAGGNENRAIALYQSGYYYAAKRQGLTGRTTSASRAMQSASLTDSFSNLFDSSSTPAPARRTRVRQAAVTPSFATETAAPARAARVRHVSTRRSRRTEPDMVTNVVNTVSSWFADEKPRRSGRRQRRG